MNINLSVFSILLHNLLSDFDVEVGSWGKDKAKTVQNLAQEILDGESFLRIDSSGISRRLSIVRLEIVNNDRPELGFLLEETQTLPDGRVRRVHRIPSGKIGAKEDPREAVIRELAEELRLAGGTYGYKSTGVRTEEKPSKSYPGIRCVYEVHAFRIEISNYLTNIPDGFTQTEPDGKVLTFRWSRNEGMPTL